MAGSGRKKQRRSKKDERLAKLIRALDHRLRRRILRQLVDAGRPLSPVRVAELLGESLSNVSYHTNLLRELEAIKLKSQRQVRGAVEHFYLPATGDNKAIMTLLEETRKADEAAG